MRVLGAAILAFVSTVGVANAEGINLTPELQSKLEGVWKGIDAASDASKLCSAHSLARSTMSLEFMRTGGTIFFDDGTDATTRAPLTGADEANGIVTLTAGNQVWRFRVTGATTMNSVRSSASLGADIDDMVYKRCQVPADRNAIALDEAQLKLLAADMPGDEAFFIDTRIAPKTGDRCKVDETQYLFFALIGPSEFRLSRWNSFSLAEKIEGGKKPKLPLDSVADWTITGARVDGGKYVFQIKDYEKPKAAVKTIHLEAKANGEYSIPEWKRTYVRCTGFQSRS
ncbi:MAG: hypothetical protein GC190_02370 [Alphaproteobacteria bacterium]|nr:hypothetical protein [Alphaproteobacteria bacterium]